MSSGSQNLLEITEKDLVRCASVFRNIRLVKLKVLLYLYFSPYKTSETITRRLKYRSQLTEQAIEQLRDQGFITRPGAEYKLTEAGKKIAEAVIELIAAMKEER